MVPCLEKQHHDQLEVNANQWRIQDFPEGGAPTPKNAIIFQFFYRKLHENERIWTPGGARVPGAPLGSANANFHFTNGSFTLHGKSNGIKWPRGFNGHWRFQRGFSQKGWIAYLLPIRKIWTIKLFVNRGQIRLLDSKTTDLDWNYSRPQWKLKFLIRDLLFTTFVKNPAGDQGRVLSSPLDVYHFHAVFFQEKFCQIRLHSSRMHTTRLLTVSPSMHCRGGGEGLPCRGGFFARGVYLARGSALPGGVSLPGGSALPGGLPCQRGSPCQRESPCQRGVCLARGFSLPGGGVCLTGGEEVWYPSMQWGRPPCGQTHTCKNITFANYVCGR